MKTTVLIPKEVPAYQELQEWSRVTPELDPDAVVAATQLLKVSLAFQEALEANFAMYDLSMGRNTALMLVARERDLHGPTTPAEIADMAGVTRATMTGLLDGLERAGLIERRASLTDRRKVEIHLTKAGEDKLREVVPDHSKRLAAVMAPLKLSEKRTLVRLLGKIAPAMTALTEREFKAP